MNRTPKMQDGHLYVGGRLAGVSTNYCFSREEEIRTLDAVTHILPFQGSPFNHSGTSLSGCKYSEQIVVSKCCGENQTLISPRSGLPSISMQAPPRLSQAKTYIILVMAASAVMSEPLITPICCRNLLVWYCPCDTRPPSH